MPSSPLFLGIDVGTTSIKAVVYDPAQGRVTHVVSHPTPLKHPRPGWAEWDPDALWDTVVRAARDAVARVASGKAIEGIGIASVGEAGVALDADGDPLHPIIAWFDRRGEEYVNKWPEGRDTRWLYLVTGHFPRTIYTAFKLLWLREHRPSVWRRLAHWLFVGDYVAYRLTGTMATVPTLAARSCLFDVVHQRWNEELLAEVGLRIDQMPPVVSTTDSVGSVLPEVAERLGLRGGIPVVVGGHDHVVGMWLAGIGLPNRVVDSSGTAQGIAVEIPRFIGERGYQAQLTCYPMAVGNTYILQGGMPTAGAALQWLADLIADGDVKQVLSWAEAAPPGSRGTGALPFLRGAGPPYRDSGLRAVLYHLDLSMGREEVARAMVEGLACFLRDVVELLERVSGRLVQEVRAIGGTNRHPFLLRVKASMLGKPLMRVDIPEVVGTGAALLAGVAAGYFPTPEAALSSVQVRFQSIQPEPAWQDAYEEVFRSYRSWISAALQASR